MNGWTVRLELGAAGPNVKEHGGDTIRLSGDFLLSAIQDGTLRDLAHFVDGKAHYCHHGIDRRWTLRQIQRPVGLWDEIWVMKSDNQSCVALTTTPGSSSHDVLWYVLVLCGAEAQQEEQPSIVAQQDKTKSGHGSPQVRLGWAVGPTGSPPSANLCLFSMQFLWFLVALEQSPSVGSITNTRTIS